MSLPSSNIVWKQYRNETPTFDLTPVEKPDFSPFLIHMTGKNSLVSILKGENKPEDAESKEYHGFIKAVMPTFDGQDAFYNSEVVCFTESPIFALDFFRYRSFRRWSEDQKYGIGFSKSELIKYRNVRPVLYFDTNTNTQILNFCNQIINGKLTITNQNGEILEFKELFSCIKPLIFPLLEETKYQGFMWEREWRCTDPKGLIFPYNGIKVICCPKEEKAEIIDILGEFKNNIEIVESWREYDDVTNYLKRRQKETHSFDINQIKEIKDIGILHNLKNQNERTINTLEAYYGVFKETVTTMDSNNIHHMIEEMRHTSDEIESQINEVMDEIKKKELLAQKNKNLNNK